MRPVSAGIFGFAALALLAAPHDARAGQKIFFGDIDFNEEIEDGLAGGGNSSVLDFQVQDNEDGGPVQVKVDAGAARQGDEAYTVRLLKRGCKIGDPVSDCPGQAEQLSPGVGLPTVLVVPALYDLNNASTGGSWYEIEVVATAGAPADFKTTLSPLQSLAVPITPGTCQSGTLIPAETDTYEFSLTLAQLGATGEIDVWFDDVSVSPGANVVELFDATRVVSKGVLSKTGDVSLDNSEIETMKLTAAGTYRVNVSNADPAGQGNYQVCVGPLPDAACPALTYGVAASSSLAEVGDRDCYTLGPLAVGTELLRINLTENAGPTAGTNEVRVEKLSPATPALDASVTGSTSINKTLSVGATGGETYRLTVNNLAEGRPNYSLTVTPEGACLGTSCTLTPGGSVKVALSDGGARPIQAGVGAASFEIDPSGSGSWTFQVRDAGNAVLCQATSSGSANFYLDNCNVGGGSQPAHIQLSGPSGGTPVVSMGPDLDPQACVLLASGDYGRTVSEKLGDEPALVGGGDEDCYQFTPGFVEPIGLDFDALSISNTKTACVYHSSVDWRGTPGAVAEFCYSGTADGTTAGAYLLAGETYDLVIDTDKWDDGGYDVCLGPEAGNDLDEGSTLTLPANESLETDDGRLDACGDADMWTIANAALVSRNVEIEVEEDEAVAGNIYATAGASSGNARTRVTLAVTLPAAGSVPLTIDHDKFESGNYVVRVRAVP